MKYTVAVHNAGEFFEDGVGDENFVMVVSNKAGRKWFSNSASACPGNVAEEAMVIEEMINDGVKVIKGAWTEVHA